MPGRYYFDLESGSDVVEDEEGAVADDVDSAIVEAIAGIAEMRVSGELPQSASDWELVVRDDVGTVLKRIPV